MRDPFDVTSPNHRVDPQLAPLLEQFPPSSVDDSVTCESWRAMLEARARQRPNHPPNDDPAVALQEQRVPGPTNAPDVHVLIYRPRQPAGTLPAYLHIHGGGYISGSAELSDARNRLIARELQCVVVSVDYRLAPESPYPGPVEDCYAALTWMHANAKPLGIDRTRIAVGGESAGGGLAAALALLARDRGEFPIAFQLLIYSMLDDRTCIDPQPSPHAGEFIWTRATNRVGWRALLGCEPGSGNVSPYAAAARAADLSRLPGACILVGALDLFVEENLDYAKRLMRAGVPTEVHLYPGAVHGFDAMANTHLGEEFSRTLLRVLGKALQARR